MTASADVLAEEFEVLEAIFPDEFTKLSDNHVQILVAPDDPEADDYPLQLRLELSYPESYPEVLPDLVLTTEDDQLSPEESSELIASLKEVGTANLGMALTFTLVSQLREGIATLTERRIQRAKDLEREKERLAYEEETARTRGTQVTEQSFRAWRDKFNREAMLVKEKEEEERLKGLSAKEREEHRKLSTRLTGRQLFEKNKSLDDSDAGLLEEGAISVDFSQFNRDEAEKEHEDDDGIRFSDSD